MRKMTNAVGTCVMGNPSRSRPIPFASSLPALLVYFGERPPIMTKILVEKFGGDPFKKYDIYEDNGKVYVKIGDNMVDTEFTAETMEQFKFEPEYED